MKRRIVLVAVAVVLALFGTVAVYGYAHSADQRAIADGRAVKVVIAKDRVAAGTSWKDAVSAGSLSVQNMPAASAPSSALTGLDAGIAGDSVAQSDIAPGQPVLRQAFGPAIAQTGVLAIPKGLIAITVSLDNPADVAGYVGPRSQVIIFVTAPLKTKKNNEDTSGDTLTVTRTVVPRAEVIATSQAAPTNVDGQTASNGAATSNTGGSVLVTLALPQHDAERVINQQNIGQLSLGLLSASSKVAMDGGYVNAGVFHTSPIWVK